MGMKRYEHATETPVRFCPPTEPRPYLPYLAEPCVWLGCSNRHSSVLRGSEQSALAAKTGNTPTIVVCVPPWNEGDDCKMSIKTTGKNCYSLTATTTPPKHKSEVCCVACNYRPPAPLVLRAHVLCSASPARTCDLVFRACSPLCAAPSSLEPAARCRARGVLGASRRAGECGLLAF